MLVGLQAYHAFIFGMHDHWVTVVVTVLPGETTDLPGMWVLESENKQMLRDAKADSKRAKVMRSGHVVDRQPTQSATCGR